jgi:hypothetical protein
MGQVRVRRVAGPGGSDAVGVQGMLARAPDRRSGRLPGQVQKYWPRSVCDAGLL